MCQHNKFYFFTITTLSLITSNLLLTLLPLCTLSLQIYCLRYYHSVPYHFQFIIYAITSLSLITSNLLFTLLPLCPLSLPIYYLRCYHSAPCHFQFIIYKSFKPGSLSDLVITLSKYRIEKLSCCRRS
jgi:hypothetical protein